VGVLLIGGRDGTLYMIKWPYFSQNDLYYMNKNQCYLFADSIVHLTVSLNMRYVYAVSSKGCLAVC
jgi:hypothetical protein